MPGQLAGCRRPDGEEDYRLLEQAGIRTIVSLLEIPHSPPWADRYLFRHLHLPVTDGPPPTFRQLDRFIGVVHAHPPVVVHCLAGIGRTGCMLAGYLVCAHGMDPRQAIRRVEQNRVYAFQTGEQEDWLLALSPRVLLPP